MNNKDIINTGKVLFWLFFIAGNINLLGYIITKIEAFAVLGYMLIVFGVPINSLVILILIIYGLVNKFYLKDCIKSSLIMCINTPIAILYFFIGISVM